MLRLTNCLMLFTEVNKRLESQDESGVGMGIKLKKYINRLTILLICISRCLNQT